MSRFTSTLSVVTFVLATAVSEVPEVRGQETELSRDELIKGWATVAQWDRTERSYRVRQSNPLTPSKPLGVTVVKVRPNGWLYDTSFRDNHSLYARSAAYGFALSKDSSKPAWVLRHFEADTSSAQAEAFERSTAQLKIAAPLDTFITVEEQQFPASEIRLETLEFMDFSPVSATLIC